MSAAGLVGQAGQAKRYRVDGEVGRFEFETYRVEGEGGAVVDTADENHKILSKALGQRDEKYIPRLPVGSKGGLEGAAVEVIGFLVKQTVADGIAYDWREYLLAGDNGTYRWLTEYDGHWNVADVLSKHPVGGSDQADIVYEGERYRHFATDKATVIQVEGEFTWRVARGESAAIGDFVAPPLLLSRERSEREVSWSLCRYVAPETIRDAFKLPHALPAPVGVYANEPNPWDETHGRVCKAFWIMALAALAVQLFFAFAAGGQKLLQQSVTFTPQMQEEFATRTFDLKDKARKLVVSNRTGLDNNWIGLDIMLVNKTTGVAWPASREIAYYYGYDDGESWTEGSRSDEVVFRDIPPGTYYLTVDPDLAPEKPVAVTDTIEVRTGKAGWSNYVLVMLFLVAFPIFTRLRRGAFEVRRWAESDHAPVAADDDSDDD